MADDLNEAKNALLELASGNPYSALADGGAATDDAKAQAVAQRVNALKSAKTPKKMADVLQDGVLMCAAVGADFDAGGVNKMQRVCQVNTSVRCVSGCT